MKTKEYAKKDGTTGYEYTAEHGDEFQSNWRTTNTLKNGPYEKHSINVTTPEGETIYLVLTKGQNKVLTRVDEETGRPIDLEGKTIRFEEYKMKEYPNKVFVGARVL